jgi:putative membrane protein
MVDILLRFVVMSLAVYLVSLVLPGMRLRSIKSAFTVSLVYGLLNFVLFKVFIFITFPLVALKYLTLGIVGVLINAVLLTITDKLIDDFEMSGFGTALIASLLISLANLGLTAVLALT